MRITLAHTLAYKGCRLFGLTFLTLGLIILVLYILVLHILPPALPPAPSETGTVIRNGMFGLLLGAILMCVRSGVMLDRQRRTVTKWWGLLVPFFKTEHRFSQAHFVTISREERRAGRGFSYEVFPVRLERAATDAINIHEPLDHDQARHLAEDVAKFVQLGIRDRSSGTEVAREAGVLDQSLRQRARRAIRTVPLSAQPPQARAIFEYGGTRAPTTIEIPPVGHTVLWFLLAIFIAGAIVIVIEGAIVIVPELFISRRGDLADMDVGMRALFTFLLILGFILPLPLRTAILRERLVVSPDKLVVTRRDIFGTKTTRLMADEVEEVEVTHAKRGIYRGYATFGGGTSRVVIRSDRGSIALGAALSNPEEVKWLRDALVHVLTSASP